MIIINLVRLQELKKSNENMRNIISHDSLTGLPNRSSARAELEEYADSGDEMTIVLFDIDDFKNINDFYSHDVGDEVLLEIAKRLTSVTEKRHAFASKFGGDEFFVLFRGISLKQNSEEIKELFEIFDSAFKIEGKRLIVKASFGVVNAINKRTKDIISDADIALARAKKLGKNIVVFFDSAMRELVNENNRISQILDEAVLNDGVTVVYQPQIDLITGQIHGYEALMRLKGDKLSPAQFIPIAETTGQIIKTARILTEKVVEQLVQWRRDGIPLKKVSINFSQIQLSDSGYLEYLINLLDMYQIPHKYICIEITESLLIANRETVTRLLNEFVKYGITLALDDFGTGYSSLSYLTFLPISVVKIDKSLVDNYLCEGKADFIKNIVRLVHSLNMKLCVEGVEFEWQNEKLKAFNCDYIQGYYYSKPISGPEIENFNKTFDLKE